MKNIPLISLLIILLTACTAPTSVPTAAILPTASSIPSATFTATDTPLPTLTPTATPLPPITLVTSREQMYQNPETLPDGSTEGKRQLVAAAILRMYRDGQIPNFDPDVQPYIPTRERINESANKFQVFFLPSDSSDWSDLSRRPVVGVTIVSGGGDVYYAVQAVKQEGTDIPGLIWYEIGSPETSQFEIERLFNRLPESTIYPALIKGSACYEIKGKALCDKYLDPELVADQLEAVNVFVKSHRVPDSMTNGQVIFLMIRGQIGL